MRVREVHSPVKVQHRGRKQLGKLNKTGYCFRITSNMVGHNHRPCGLQQVIAHCVEGLESGRQWGVYSSSIGIREGWVCLKFVFLKGNVETQVDRPFGLSAGCLLYTSPSPRDGLLS